MQITQDYPVLFVLKCSYKLLKKIIGKDPLGMVFTMPTKICQNFSFQIYVALGIYRW
jgi:hypothetical protein